MENAPAIVERGAMTAQDFMPVLEVQQAVERRNAIVTFTQKIMIEGTDYGVIPGVAKPTLLQPGAEKLIAFFGLTPCMELVDKIEDWNGKQHGEPLFFYRYRCTLKRGERVLGIEEASANSWEVKYRYRWVPEDQVPDHIDKGRLVKRDSSITEFDFAISKAETAGQYGKPAEYWKRFTDAILADTAIREKKKTKAGKELDAWTIPAVAYRIPNPENADTINTIMQMAEKRAKIRAVRSCTGASEFFTQDVEDMTIIDITPDKVHTDAAPGGGSQPVDARTERGSVPADSDAQARQSSAVPGAASTTEAQFYEDDALLKLKESRTIADLTKIFNSIPAEHRRPGTNVFKTFKGRRDELAPGKGAE